MGHGVVLPDLLSWTKGLPRCGAQSCSTAAFVLSSLAVVAICFVYFDLGVAPTSLSLQGQADFYATESAAPSPGPVASVDAKEPAVAVDEVLQPLPKGGSGEDVSDQPQSAPSPQPSSKGEDADPCSLAPAPIDGHTDTTQTEQQVDHPSLPPSGRSCDFYSGRWERDNASYPLYGAQDCPFQDRGFSCQDHRRPDREYEQWRWQPEACDLPRFDPQQVLERLRGSRLVFVGDSLGRNQWESMLCMLGSGVSNKSRVYEVDGNPITKHMGYLRYRFQDWNCTVEYYRSPFLVRQGRAPAEHPKGVKYALKLGEMDGLSVRWRNADALVFNAGHWWTDAKTIQSGTFFQEGQRMNMTMNIQEAFMKAMITWSSWLKSNVDPARTRVFFRGFEAVHYIGGTWNRGGRCHLETQPYGLDEQTFGARWTNDVIVRELKSVKHVTYLNITRLTDYRKDAHPSIWSSYPPSALNRQDCSHWCLPGVPDTWNEILLAELMKSHGAT